MLEVRDPADMRSVAGEGPEMTAGQVAAAYVRARAEARVEITKTAGFRDCYASFAPQPWGELLSDARPGTRTSIRVEPIGVVLAICPWNDPLITPARKLGPALIALIAGNAVQAELGGKNVCVVRADADVDMAAATTASAAFAQARQRCPAPGRLIIEDSAGFDDAVRYPW